MSNPKRLQEYISSKVLSHTHRSLPGSETIIETAFRLLLTWLNGSHEDAEDVLAVTVSEFIPYYEKVKDTKTLMNPQAVFLSIARRRSIDLIRNRNSRLQVAGTETSIEQEDHSVESGYEHVVREEARNAVKTALQRLLDTTNDRRHKAVLELHYIKCIEPHAKIAEQAGIEANNVKVILHRARKKLAKILNNQLPTP